MVDRIEIVEWRHWQQRDFVAPCSEQVPHDDCKSRGEEGDESSGNEGGSAEPAEVEADDAA
jgi:hypothetical protein